MERETEELVRRMKEGDQEAFDQLVRYYYEKTLRMAYLISGNEADSQDIVQETFVICYLNRRKIQEPACFERWLFKTLTREAWRVCRKSRREQPAEEIFGEQEPQSPSVLETVIEDSTNRELYQAICELPPKQRTALVLYYFNGMGTKEIAKICGCLEGTVKSRLHTARSRLRLLLKENRDGLGKEALL